MSDEAELALPPGLEDQFSFVAPGDSALRRKTIRTIERLVGQRELMQLYLRNRAAPRPEEPFFEAGLRLLRLRLAYDEARLAAIPKEGPLIFVSNHPYGVLDGIGACVLADRARGDFRILINSLLTGPEEMRLNSLPIDFRLTRDAMATNLRTRAEARRTLADGGTLILFPGGTVSTRMRAFSRLPAFDPAWKPFVSQLIQKSRASVVPLYFEGENGWAFHAASHLSATLRIALLFREVRKQMGGALSVRIGDVIPYEEIAHIRDRHALAQHLRDLTYSLGGREVPANYGPRLARRLQLDPPREILPSDEGKPSDRFRIAY